MSAEDYRAPRKAKLEAFKELWVEYHVEPACTCASWPLSPEDERELCEDPPHRSPCSPASVRSQAS